MLLVVLHQQYLRTFLQDLVDQVHTEMMHLIAHFLYFVVEAHAFGLDTMEREGDASQSLEMVELVSTSHQITLVDALVE